MLRKLFGILITIGEAVAYVGSGMYGQVSELGLGNCVLIVAQLVFAVACHLGRAALNAAVL